MQQRVCPTRISNFSTTNIILVFRAKVESIFLESFMYYCGNYRTLISSNLAPKTWVKFVLNFLSAVACCSLQSNISPYAPLQCGYVRLATHRTYVGPPLYAVRVAARNSQLVLYLKATLIHKSMHRLLILVYSICILPQYL